MTLQIKPRLQQSELKPVGSAHDHIYDWLISLLMTYHIAMMITSTITIAWTKRLAQMVSAEDLHGLFRCGLQTTLDATLPTKSNQAQWNSSNTEQRF